MESFAALAREIAALSGHACADEPTREVGGGSINSCYYWPSVSAPMFVKIAPRESAAAFAAEADGLRELDAVHALRVPRVLATGVAGASAFLALEWLEVGRADEACEARLGAGLAALHRVSASRFGWWRDNTIGRSPQANGWCTQWLEFFRERRLRPQLALAARGSFAGLLAARGERLLAALPMLLADHNPQPALLHGDLWGGNWLATRGGEPALFDPAVYYGDRETDLAMTRLFGGFGTAFYRAYESAGPLPRGASLRVDLYNLYHVLNHANLFGGGYARQARELIDRLLAEVG